MSKVESSEDRRIREMTEAAFRRKADHRKRTQQALTSQSFSQVMAKKAESEQAHRASEQRGSEMKRQTMARQALLLRRSAPKPHDPRQVLHRAAIQQAAEDERQRLRHASTQQQGGVLADRRSQFGRRETLEAERQRQTDLRVDERDLDRVEDKDEEVREEVRRERQDPIDGQGHRDPHHRDRSSGDSDEGRDPAQAVQAAEGPRRRFVDAPVSPEALQEIVEALFAAHREDGRSRLLVELKGPGLEGARLEITKESGAFHCSFFGLSASTARSLREAQPRLQARLGERGLKLGRLNFG